MLTEQGTQTSELYSGGLTLSWCTDAQEIRAAQKLRYRVFALEMGAKLSSTDGEIDADEFDPWCDHLVVKLGGDKVIGTYRVLRPERAYELGRFYSDAEFDLTPLKQLTGRMIEVGRSCVDSKYRTGGVIMTLWSGLAQFMTQHGYDHALGCASVPLGDGGQMANRIYQNFMTSGAISGQFNVAPVSPLPLRQVKDIVKTDLPPLLKGYLRLGAKICGAPAFDPNFNTADFLTLLSIHDIQPRYARHFFSGKNI